MADRFSSAFDPTPFAIKNCHRSVDNNPFITGIHYNRASQLNDGELFGLMFQKFPEIRQLDLTRNVVDTKRLLKFIDQFQVDSFTFKKRTFLPALAENRSFIRDFSFDLDDCDSMSTKIVTGGFDFIFKFKSLTNLYFSSCPLSLHFVARLLEELPLLEFLKFGSNSDLSYDFTIRLPSSFSINDMHKPYVVNKRIAGKEEARELVNYWKRLLRNDGIVCPEQLKRLILHIQAEDLISRIMMRRCIYQPKEEMSAEDWKEALNKNYQDFWTYSGY